MHLQPGTAYGIIIFGRSEEFEGQRSEEVFVYTLQPIGKLGHVIGKLGHVIGKLGHVIGKLGHVIGKLGRDW